MNNVYFAIYNQFEEDETYSGDALLKALVKVIKDTTVSVISNINNPKPKEEQNMKKIH